ncbi:hypothetical protein JOM56_009737 [Amanita muscaria]
MYNLRRESERRTTLPPDEAVLPLIVCGGGTLARTIVQPSSRPNRSQTGSDSDYEPTDASSTTGSERGSVAMADDHGTQPGSSLFSRSNTPDINVSDGNRGGLPCFVAAESLTGAITCPPPTSDAFQGLLIVANEMGFIVLCTPLPKSVLGTYGCLVQSTEAAVSSITSLLQTLDGHEVWLATSRKPILMDGKKYHESPMAGYIELGCLTALDRSVEFRPAVDCDERRQLMEMQDITIGTPIYILYIWSSESERASPVLWGPSALGNSNIDVAAQVDVAALLMEEQHMALFNELIIDAPTAQSTFTMIIFMSNRLTKERTMIDWLGDLLQTPLSEARHLRPFKLDMLERQNNLRGVRQKTGEGSCSVRGGKRGSPEESGDESGD